MDSAGTKMCIAVVPLKVISASSHSGTWRRPAGLRDGADDSGVATGCAVLTT
jgi:hypothetical protein